MISVFDVTASVIGLLLIFQTFRSTTSQAKFNIKSFGSLELMTDEIRASKDQISVYKVVSILFSGLWILIVINFGQDFISGWVLLIICGLTIALSNFLVSELKRSKLRRLYYKSQDDSNLALRISELSKKITKDSLVILLITATASGYWAYQVQKNERELRDIAVARALDLSGQGKCGNFSDINVFDGGETVVKNGGWPCIYLGQIDSIRFEEKSGKANLCFMASFNVEQGPPGYESFALNAYVREVCVSKDEYFGWSQSALEDSIQEIIGPEINPLVGELCKRYRFSMTYEQLVTYCA